MTGGISRRLYGPRGWAILALFCVAVFVVMPLLNLAVPPDSRFHCRRTG